MNEIELLNRLSRAAGREAVPELDVRRRVVASLEGREDDAWIGPLAWIAAFSTAAAVPASVLTLVSLELFTDPFSGMFQAAAWMLL
jgi:hypothetical protein